MKLKNKLSMLMLAGAMSIGLFTACNDQVTDDASAHSSNTEVSGTLLLDKMTTFTLFLYSNGNSGVYNEEWDIFEELARRTNVKLEGVVPLTSSDRDQAFNMMISSGDLPDIIAWNDIADFEKLGRDGGLIPLQDLIKEHAPHIQNYLDTDPDFKSVATSLDGNIYQVPRINEIKSAEFWWIRQDWLDILGLEVPKTVDELYEVLTAFRNEDPNRNGKKDEVPLFDRAGAKMADEYLYLWDTSIGFYEEEGKMVFEPLEEDFKTGIKSYAKWYAEGLIDPEIFTGNKATRDTLLGTNRGGVTHDWQSAGGYNELLVNEVSGFNFVGMAPPANQHGNIVERTARTASPGWGISATCEDPVTIIKYFDYIFTEEAQYLTSCGLEGVTYTLNDDGTITYKDLVKNAPEGMLAHLIQYGVNTDIGRRVLATYEIAQMSPAVAATAQMYSDHTEEWYNLDAPAYFDGRMNLKIIPEMEAEYLQIMATVDSYVEEKFQGWILGTSDFDQDYDSFIKELKDRGIDRATEIVQASYDLQYK